ncbi:hypothetical protein EVB27_086 [Rhizobium phage RHph_TM16]|nr:hypothetical protein EVB27_086 [Rhizobium phage RHph_TM16]
MIKTCVICNRPNQRKSPKAIYCSNDCARTAAQEKRVVKYRSDPAYRERTLKLQTGRYANLNPVDKAARISKNREWYNANRDRVTEQRKADYAANSEFYKAKSAANRAANPSYSREYAARKKLELAAALADQKRLKELEVEIQKLKEQGLA